MAKVLIDGQEYVPVPRELTSPVAGGWHEVPLVEGTYWMATKRKHARRWWLEWMPVHVVVTEDRGPLVRTFNGDDYKPYWSFHRARFLGPMKTPPPPVE